ncbi:AAA family ATPase [Treponema primitia]|uniref:ParA family protein n=1 Tax=Treponema primitia TaxID=88058 RepID=UPI00397F9D0B
MILFGQLEKAIENILNQYLQLMGSLDWLVINRDLNGKIRLITDQKKEKDFDNNPDLISLVKTIADTIQPHGYTSDKMVLFESKLKDAVQGAPNFKLKNFPNVTFVDRLLSVSDWSFITPVSKGIPRIVFFSIKGGVGRSTALAVTARHLAEKGKKVMVIDLDLESPGISSSLLPQDQCPEYGIADWLVEDLVDNGDEIIKDMVSSSALSHNGKIWVAPAHGKEPGEYIAKLGRAWMPKMLKDKTREPWYKRLNRLLDNLENIHKPDVILIDSRAGIDEVSGACVTCLGAKNVLLFAMDSEQTWGGYTILFEHWRRYGVAGDIRGRLQMVGALIPETGADIYFDSLCERSWNLFLERLYDIVPAGEAEDKYFTYNKADDDAPHFPCIIRWNRGFSTLQNLYSPAQFNFDVDQIKAVFGSLLSTVEGMITDG